MSKRFFVLFMIFSLIFSLGASAQTQRLLIEEAPFLIRPGKAERIVFISKTEGLGSLLLQDTKGKTVAALYPEFRIYEGENHIIWNGFDSDMKAIVPGIYQLLLQSGEERAMHKIQIGELSPQITQLLVQDARIIPGQEWNMSVQVNMPGRLMVVFHVADKNYEIYKSDIPQGNTQITWDGLIMEEAPPAGGHTLSVLFMDESGYPANQQQLILEVAEPINSLPDVPKEKVIPDGEPGSTQPADQTAGDSPQAAESHREIQYSVPTQEEVSPEEYGNDFWRLPVGKFDEDAIWKVMIQDITVLWGKDQRDTYKLRAAKDDSMKRENIVGEVGYESQGVHVIEQYDDGWSLIEVYNSSYGPNNRTRRGYGNTDELIRGYVRTSELKVIKPRDDYGILIDKLKQRLYVFKDGKVITELLISTGVPTRQQPWNETPSGEFLMVSRVGEFNAGNLVCRMAMRVNGGALIHEVPYIVNESTGYWDYSSQERQLGQKASHGCIRVQRLNNSDGINMTWLWNNIKLNTKVLIWDDDHRFYEYPDEQLALFYNPDGGKYYHLDQNCSSIKSRFLPLKGEMTYQELDNKEFSKLIPCSYCNPPLRFSEIEKLNKGNGF